MIEMYYELVINHKRTCDPNKATSKCPLTPSNIRDDVIALLKERGYDEDGNKVG